MTDIAIRVSNLSKCYQIYNAPRDRLKQFVVPRLQRMAGQTPRQYYREFWALKDISFEIKKGETVGIIGRENVYMNAALLGISKKEVGERFDDIAAFADIGEFIEQPVKTYSSGMYVRLAFAEYLTRCETHFVYCRAVACLNEA